MTFWKLHPWNYNLDNLDVAPGLEDRWLTSQTFEDDSHLHFVKLFVFIFDDMNSTKTTEQSGL